MKEQVLEGFDTERRQALGNSRSDAAKRRDSYVVRMSRFSHTVAGPLQASSTMMPSTSTPTPLGSAATPTAARAG